MTEWETCKKCRSDDDIPTCRQCPIRAEAEAKLAEAQGAYQCVKVAADGFKAKLAAAEKIIKQDSALWRELFCPTCPRIASLEAESDNLEEQLVDMMAQRDEAVFERDHLYRDLKSAEVEIEHLRHHGKLMKAELCPYCHPGGADPEGGGE